MPNFQRMSRRRPSRPGRGALPSFTNVNNASIVTGVPPSVHGIKREFLLRHAGGRRSDDELGEVSPLRDDFPRRPRALGERSPSSPPRKSCETYSPRVCSESRLQAANHSRVLSARKTR